jgi:hypothetical protein
MHDGGRKRKKAPGGQEPFQCAPPEADGLNLYTLNELPQPQVLLTLGLLNLNPAPSSVSM